ncbi:MAG: hypothetical protein JWO81_653 [Alphaproteobacteria bacterium]|nr:hypothetical protein [Alphaproteobacteria bacterium]
MSKALSAIHTHALDFWMARAAVGLQLLLVNRLTVGPRWLAPTVELALLAPLSIATAWAQDLVVRATEERHWHMIAVRRRMIRTLAVLLTGLVTLINLGSLVMLVDALLGGQAGNNGRPLLLDAVDIWTINVVAFALWYWNIDRGGPARGIAGKCVTDFLFPQMTMEPRDAEWSPGFVDYLFVSYTNATAFSPTDTMPLTPRAKALMMVQSGISLLTIALVAARAVNILS